MTSLERVLTTLQHKEPDLVPVFLLLTMHGAKELGLTLKEYFSKAENVVEGQVRLQKKYGHDCYHTLFYASVEYEAFGGKVVFSEDGPVNSGAPVIISRDDIFNLKTPEISKAHMLQETLKAIKLLNKASNGTIPTLGVVISPFSLPVMLMGFSAYLNLIYEDREAFDRLMQTTNEFAINWGKAQLEAGATALVYFDPLAAKDIIDEKTYKETGLKIAKSAIPAFGGPVGMHLASGKSIGRIDKYIETGVGLIGVSSSENLKKIKETCKSKISVVGNLNGIQMASWSKQEAKKEVKQAILDGGHGGGFILSDTHGEIPYQVSDETLQIIMETARNVGKYPINQKS
jgi:uroporphyrinogen decarboxylase